MPDRVLIKLTNGELLGVVTDSPCEVYVIDDNTPRDRVYRLTMIHDVSTALVDQEMAGATPGYHGDGSEAATSLEQTVVTRMHPDA